MTPSLSLTVDDGLARITLNRPDRLNAIDREMAEAWAAAVAHVVDRADIGAILIDATGPSFCAGGDLRHMATTMDAGTELTALAGVINEGILGLVNSAIPVVAAAHGTTAGGGLGLLLASDYAVVGEDSRIGSLYAKVGLTPDLAVSALLADAVGSRRALQLTLRDTLLTAQQALDWGLVAEVVAPGEVGARAEAVARWWLSGATEAYGDAKRLLRSRSSRTFAEQLAEEARTIGAAFDRPEARERIRGFAGTSG